MKTRKYKNGSAICRTYLKPVGHGIEVGFIYGGTPIFVGNFVHTKDANRFYTLMTKDLRKFSKKFKVGPTYPKTLIKQMLGTELHTLYYKFVSKLVPAYTRTANSKNNQNIRKFKRVERKAKWTPKEKKPCLKAA